MPPKRVNPKKIAAIIKAKSIKGSNIDTEEKKIAPQDPIQFKLDNNPLFNIKVFKYK